MPMLSCSYCSSARATSRNPAAEVLLRSHVTLLQGKILSLLQTSIYSMRHMTKNTEETEAQIFFLIPPPHLSVVLICRALLNILAPMSSMLFPLKSTFLRQVLLPRALTSTVPRERRRESVRDRDCRAWRGGRGTSTCVSTVCVFV